MGTFTLPLQRWQRVRGALVLVATAALFALGSPITPLWAAAKPTTHTVVIQAVSYQPAALTIKRGDTVVWVNKDPIPHTVTAAGDFDSKSIAPGASWKYRATKEGSYAYTCTFHPNMKATLTVE